MNDRVFNQAVDKLRSRERRERLEIDRVVTLTLENEKITRLLDIGTGSGLFAEAFYRKNITVSGVDLNPEMINAAREYLPYCDFRIGKAEDLPYVNKSFDYAFMGLILHEADDTLKALKEARRVAAPGLAVLEWDYKMEEMGPPLEHRLQPEKIESLAKEAGFSRFEVHKLKTLVLYKLS